MATLDEQLAYVVVFDDPHNPGRLRAHMKIFDSVGDATAKQFEIGNTQKTRTWVMAFPDPRQVANA